MIQEQIRKKTRSLSDEIKKIKMKTAKFEKRKVWDPEKKYWAWDENKSEWIKVTVQVASIHPSHPDWERYARAKREVSVLLTAHSILKYFGDDPRVIKNLNKPDIKELIAQKKLRDHAKRPSNVAFGALRLLKKLCKSQKVMVTA